MDIELFKIDKLKRQLGLIGSRIDGAERQADIDEIEEEICEELKRDLRPLRQKHWKFGVLKKLRMPTSSTIISYGIDGKSVLSRFEDDEWKIWIDGALRTFNFRQNSKERNFDLTGEIADHHVYFSKIFAWFMLPGNFPGSNIKSPRTSINNIDNCRYLIALLIEKGFLLNIDNVETKPLCLLNVAELKSKIRDLIKSGHSISQIAGLYRAIGRWVQMADYAELPNEFIPSFNIGDWHGDGVFTNEVIRYEAEKITPWKAIPHDDLIRLLQQCQVYIQDFSKDILVMNHLIKVERNNIAIEKQKKPIISKGETKEIFEAIKNHQFAVDPRTGNPWFSVKVAKDTIGSQDVIPLTQFNKEIYKLLDCCIFELLLWSATRVREMINFKVDGLIINGKRLVRTDDAIKVFTDAFGPKGTSTPRFELEFLSFKTAKTKKGKIRKIPLTTDAAHAFCVLVEMLRPFRDKHNNAFLFSSGVMYPTKCLNDPQAHAVNTYFTFRLGKLCKQVGVEYHHPHRCRKTLATIIINKSPYSLELIQRLLGHNTPSMTLRYLMSLPGIAEDVRKHITASNKSRILDILSAVATRRMSGTAAEKLMTAIPCEKLAAEILPDTIHEYTELLISDPNFVIIKAPAAWCLRLQTFRPQQLPCLPNIGLIDFPPENLAPNPRNCRPWECGYAAHTRHHLQRAMDNRDASIKLASRPGIRAALSDSFSVQGAYWGNTVRHLEQGHDDFQEMVPAAVLYS